MAARGGGVRLAVPFKPSRQISHRPGNSFPNERLRLFEMIVTEHVLRLTNH